jgi:ATP synthase protein I
MSTPSVPSESDRSMGEYQQLQYKLLLTTLALMGIIFTSVWLYYDLPVALNYLLGGCTGMVYLRMLARDVARIDGSSTNLGYGRLAPLVGVLIFATQWQNLQIVPIFLGFLTYKAAIIIYVLRTSFLS